MSKHQQLLEFVSNCPSDWSTCPIYAKGVVMKDGKIAKGKSPYGEAIRPGAHWSPSRSALLIEREPENFKAYKFLGNCYKDLKITTYPTSTVVQGEYNYAMRAVQETIAKCYEEFNMAVYVAKIIPGYEAL